MINIDRCIKSSPLPGDLGNPDENVRSDADSDVDDHLVERYLDLDVVATRVFVQEPFLASCAVLTSL